MSTDDPQTQTLAPEKAIEKAKPKMPPEVTGISAITYPCGCKAEDEGANLPATCPKHPEQAKKVFVSRHGELFDETQHAVESDGKPKVDSTGRLIRKEHDYRAPRSSGFFGTSH